MVGRILGHYRIVEEIGAGGMGVVYRARDERLERDVAIKILRAGLLTDEAARRRFRQEALALSQLNHPNITTAHDFDTEDGIDFLVMEYVDGKSIRGPLPSTEIIRLGRQLAEGLATAHAQGVIHRDLKPGNLRITPDGRLKILDFGLAKFVAAPKEGDATATMNHEIAGTLPYMAPEQLRGGHVDERTDVYAAGAVLYELATGRRVFGDAHGPDLISAILKENPPSTRQLPAALDRIVMRCLAKEPERRYPSARALLADLESGPAARTWKWPAAVAAAVLMLAGSGYWWKTHSRAAGSEAHLVSLAVLPFRMLNRVDDTAYLALGIPDALITRVANAGQVRVRSTSAILPYEQQPVDSRKAGQTLACDYVLTGTIQGSGNRVRINVQLLRSNDGSAAWGKAYDLSRADLIGLEDTLVEQVVTALQVQLTAAERERVYRRYTQNTAAYELYLRGRNELARQRAPAAVRDFEDALKIDPNYALAHAGLAIASGLLRIGSISPAEGPQWERRSASEARRALDLDPNLAEAHEAMAAVYRWSDFDWEHLIEECDRALQLNPSLYLPHRYRGDAFRHLGLLDLVENEVRAAHENNPGVNPEDANLLGAAALWDGRYGDVESLMRRGHAVGAALHPGAYLAEAWFYLGRKQEAEGMLLELHAPTVSGRLADAARASFLAAEGRRPEAEDLLRAVTSIEYKEHHSTYSVGVAYAQLGNRAEALRALKRAAATGFVCYPWYARDPLLDPLRKDPEFVQFVEDLRKGWEAAKVRFGSHTEAP